MGYCLGITDWDQWMKSHHIKLKDPQKDIKKNSEVKSASMEKALQSYRRKKHASET